MKLTPDIFMSVNCQDIRLWIVQFACCGSPPGVMMADTLSFTAKVEVVLSITSLTANHVSYPQLTATLVVI